MIYAINEKTKEHRVVEVEHNGRMRIPCRNPLLEKGWQYVQADADGWIKWEGGECPLKEGAMVSVRYRKYGERTGAALDESYNLEQSFWDHDENNGYDIIAYRPILEDKAVAVPGEERYVTVEDVDFDRYGWWTEGKRYRVEERDGQEGVFADDGDFYSIDGRLLAKGGYFKAAPGNTHGADCSQEWDGVGLPPVGTVCEVLHDGEKLNAEILAHYQPHQDAPMVAVYAYPVEGGRMVSQKIRSQFSPIRSDEDRFAESAVAYMERAVENKTGEPANSRHLEVAAKALYRAGYRKTNTNEEK